MIIRVICFYYHLIQQKEDAETEDSNQLEDKEQEATQADSDEDDDEGGNVVDMDSFLESGAIEDEDPNLYITYKNDTKSDAQNDVDGEALVSTRTYDLHITYDKYYQVDFGCVCIQNNQHFNLLETESYFIRFQNKHMTGELHYRKLHKEND